MKLFLLFFIAENTIEGGVFNFDVLAHPTLIRPCVCVKVEGSRSSAVPWVNYDRPTKEVEHRILTSPLIISASIRGNY